MTSGPSSSGGARSKALVREQRDKCRGILFMECPRQGVQKSVYCKLVFGAACLLTHFNDGLFLTWSPQQPSYARQIFALPGCVPVLLTYRDISRQAASCALLDSIVSVC